MISANFPDERYSLIRRAICKKTLNGFYLVEKVLLFRKCQYVYAVNVIE